MNRAIAGFHCDEIGDWVADLTCGHGQHVRHQPPFQLREWVLEAEGRISKVGTLLACPLCDRAELPDGLSFVRSSPVWDEDTMPAGLRHTHRLAASTWGQFNVLKGQLRFVAATEPELDVVLGPGSAQGIPPELEHEVHPLGSVRFSIAFLSIPSVTTSTLSDVEEGGRRGVAPPSPANDEGGEAAGMAHPVCPDCGAMRVPSGDGFRVCCQP